MAIPSSASSEERAPGWRYTRPAFGRTGRSLSENNFAKERRDWVAILLREVLQNGLDARVSGADGEPVLITFQEITLPEDDAGLVDRLITVEHASRFRSSVRDLDAVPESIRKFLVIEDFCTTGLIGETANPDVDGKGQNWNAFWFREGEGGKEHGSGNGGAGQGKITYFSTSQIRTIFAYTVRTDDARELVYGASSFMRDYDYDHNGTVKKWLRDSYWGISVTTDDGAIAVPSADAGIAATFREKFGVRRQAGQSGLSLVIPAPRQFGVDEAIAITIAEFFAPIVRGDLVVVIGDTRLDAATIVSMADARLSDKRARELHTCMTKGYRSFVALALDRSRLNQIETAPPVDAIAQLCETSFAPAVLTRMRDALASEGLVSVRFPVTVKPKTSDPLTCYFDVHLMCPLELGQVEQAVIRRDLLIGEEPLGGGSLRQHARGLTLINDRELSKLLLSAEEATHLRWNARLPRLREYYRSGADVVSFVRNAMAKLLEVLSGGEQATDFSALAKYFPVPGGSASVKTKGRKSPKGEQESENGPIPAPVPKKLALKTLEDGCSVVPSKAGALSSADLPIKAELEFAYEGLDKDAFAEYDPLDFDIAESSFTVTATNCTVGERSRNRISFEVRDPLFKLEVSGFDRNIRLRARLNYKEACDAAVIDSE